MDYLTDSVAESVTCIPTPPEGEKVNQCDLTGREEVNSIHGLLGQLASASGSCIDKTQAQPDFLYPNIILPLKDISDMLDIGYKVIAKIFNWQKILVKKVSTV